MRNRIIFAAPLAFFIFLGPVAALPQTIPAPPPPPGSQADIEALKKTAPRVFVDCDYCDIEYIKTEITFVNYVRDRKEAQIHIMITVQSTGAGGVEYCMHFSGQQEFAGMDGDQPAPAQGPVFGGLRQLLHDP